MSDSLTMTYRVGRLIRRLAKRSYSAVMYRLIFLRCWYSVAWSKSRGVSDTKRNPELVVSLTTIPERIGMVSLCIDTLLRQSLKPDRIILWLSESSDPGRPEVNKQSLPADLLRLIDRGLEIHWCKDIGPYRKIIPTLLEHPGALIVTADDDIFYPRDWLELLYVAYRHEPQYIHCHRAHLIRYGDSGLPVPYRQWDLEAVGVLGPSNDLLPTEGAGVLYAPGHLPPDVLNESAFLSCCPRADDIWLKAMALLAGVPCKKVSRECFPIVEIRIPNNRKLMDENVMLGGNDQQVRAVAELYPVFRAVRTSDE